MRGSIRSHRHLPVAALLACTIVLGGAALPAAGAAAQTATDPAAGAQSVLDRVLGPGNSVVQVVQQVSATHRVTRSLHWGAATTAGLSVDRLVTSNGSTSSTTVVNDVANNVVALDTPAGTVLQQNATVVVDRAAMGTTSVAQIKRLVAAAVGLRPRRGDRLFVLVTRLPHAAPSAPRAQTWAEVARPYAVPGIEGLGVLAAMLILVLAVRGRGRRKDDLRPS